jgi:TIR domain
MQEAMLRWTLQLMNIQAEAAPMSDAGSTKARLFVSYSRKDLAFAERLSEALGALGFNVWVDLKGIRPSEEWMTAIQTAIEGSDAVVFVVSPDSVDPTSFRAQEIEHAHHHNKRFVPVVWRGVDYALASSTTPLHV